MVYHSQIIANTGVILESWGGRGGT